MTVEFVALTEYGGYGPSRYVEMEQPPRRGDRVVLERQSFRVQDVTWEVDPPGSVQATVHLQYI